MLSHIVKTPLNEYEFQNYIVQKQTQLDGKMSKRWKNFQYKMVP